jgi:hypothetical protein
MSSLQEVHSEQAAAARKCPFSDKTGFKSIGCHLPHCQKRNGRDYSMYLSAKTLSKKTAASHKFCPKCHKRFTHLRTSATCKNIPSVPPIPAVTQTNYPQGSSNSDPSAISKPDPAISNFTPLDYHHKPRVKLPPTQEEWEDANSYFSRVLVPQVLCETSPDSKNSRLSDGIYDFLANKYGTRQHSKRRRRQEKHALALNKARKLKNEARRELHRARVNSTLSAEEIRSLARKFYQLVRSHSCCRKAYQQVPGGLGRLYRNECHQTFWSFAKQLLDESSQTSIEPQFSEEEGIQYFTETYSAKPKSFASPDWIPSPPSPTAEFNCEEITMMEISAAVRKSKTKSTPCPLDAIPYIVFKKCPALMTALHNLFNTCWMQSTVLMQWKTASVKLIGKQAAEDNPTLPSNFRPIALTSCVGKL